MNTPALFILILTLAITVPVIIIIANPHWLSYLRRRWLRLPAEPEVSAWQQSYFTDFIDLLTRLNYPDAIPGFGIVSVNLTSRSRDDFC
jgi:hypothetical protein